MSLSRESYREEIVLAGVSPCDSLSRRLERSVTLWAENYLCTSLRYVLH
jgi:hypothetical protein